MPELVFLNIVEQIHCSKTTKKKLDIHFLVKCPSGRSTRMKNIKHACNVEQCTPKLDIYLTQPRALIDFSIE